MLRARVERRGAGRSYAKMCSTPLHLPLESGRSHSSQRKIPFAVVGSDQEIDTADGRRVRGRAYPWGVIEVDNEAHCDFVKLRQMLIRSHMEELKEHTHDALYEKYRSEKLVAMGVTQDQSVFKEVNPAAKMAEDRALHEAKLAKMENEMKLVFQQKVAEKEAKLKQRCVALLSAAWA